MDAHATRTSSSARNSGELRPLLVDSKQAALLLGIGRTTLYVLIDDGEVTPVRIGRSVRFPLADLERFVAERSAGGLSAEQRADPPVGATPRRPARRTSRSTGAPTLFDTAN